MLSDTVLRQNPHNVYEWLNRIALAEGDDMKTLQAYTQAVTQIDT